MFCACFIVFMCGYHTYCVFMPVLVLFGSCLQGGSPTPGGSMVGTVGLFARSVAAVCLYRQNLVLGRFNVSPFDSLVFLLLSGTDSHMLAGMSSPYLSSQSTK